MSYLLIAGTVDLGKSVSINAMILSLLYYLSPTQRRLIIDNPKILKLPVYNGISHLLTSTAPDLCKVVKALK